MKYYIYTFGVNQWFSIYVKDSVSPDNSRSLDNDTLNSVNCPFVPLARSSFNHHVLILWLGMWLWSTKKKVQVCGLCLNQGHRPLSAWRPSCGVASSAGVVAVCASECLWYHWPLLVLGRDRPMTHTHLRISQRSASARVRMMKRCRRCWAGAASLFTRDTPPLCGNSMFLCRSSGFNYF